MPTLSVYAFDRPGPEQAGPFWQAHAGFSTWEWSTISGLSSTQSILAWVRVDSEDVLDVSTVANGPLAINQIDALLTAPASRSGPVRTSYITWASCPSWLHDPNPDLHQPWDLLLTINIDFHIETPWYCSNADGTLTFYVFPSLDGGGNLGARVDGAGYSYGGGGPFCTDDINSALDASLPGGMTALQGLLDEALPLWAGGRTFNMLYLLPGHGDKGGFSQDNADDNVALAVIPNG